LANPELSEGIFSTWSAYRVGFSKEIAAKLILMPVFV
jgi:hypothetical protein